MRDPLPVDAVVAEVRAHLSSRRAAVLVAGPGAGKTTRVPPALVDDGRVLVLQPRRVAVRAVAARIAEERGWTLGREVGWHVRFERRFGPDTALLVVTEGILTARLQQDPLLSDVRTVVLDEFHERSLHADLGLALARQAWRARSDLRLLVMSATLDAGPVARFLDDCPVVEVAGARHPLAIEYAPGEGVAEAVRHVLPRTTGQVLCFLPGRREIEAAQGELAAARELAGVDVVPLHGGLDGEAQDAAIRPSGTRRVSLATNIAETSRPVPGVSVVVDGGQVKVARYDAARGVDRLELERVTADSATQRAGRAARLGPGLARRLWDARDRLRPSREPDVARVDLAGAVLDVVAWGADPRDFEWFDAPPAHALDAAVTLLERLGAVEAAGGRTVATPLGRRLQRWPVHVRLARILLDGGGAPAVAAACALLSEGVARGPGGVTTSCDLLADLDRFASQPPHVRQVARELERIAGREIDRPAADVSEIALHRALFSGFADRLGRRRPGTPGRVTLASGHGATLARESGVRDGEFLVALEVRGTETRGVSEARIHLASAVDPAWVVPTGIAVEHTLDADTGQVRARRVARYGALVVAETPVPVDAEAAARVLAEAWQQRGPTDADAEVLRRLRFAGLDPDVASAVARAATAARTLRDVRLADGLDAEVIRALDRLAPTSLPVPSGRRAPLGYADDGTVTASVKLQELFGLADTPRLGPARVAVTFELLAPNGRPVQTTRDLRSFWQRTYPEVRKELRGRYPKHPWPDDPWTATPTHRTTRRR